MPVTIGGSGPITGVTSINTTVSDTELGYLDGVTSAIQSQINTAGGLVKITDQSFSAASSVSVNNCFSATYANYRLIYQLAGSANANLHIRMRASGSDFTSSLYSSAISGLTAGNVTANTTSGGQTSAGFLTDIYGPDTNQWQMAGADIIGPALSQIKAVCFLGVGRTAVADVKMNAGIVAVNTSTAFDGFTLYPSSGNITGNLRVYGYRN